MESFPTELIYVLVFAAIVLVQYVMKRFGRQRQQAARDEPLPQMPKEVKKTPAAASVSSMTDGRVGRTGAPSASSALPRRRFSRRLLMGTRREVQNAIVTATILGPCRAYQPHDDR
jgi:hypothetical protein